MTASSAMDADASRRLDEYCDTIGDVLGHKKRRESFALYTRAFKVILLRTAREIMKYDIGIAVISVGHGAFEYVGIS